MACMLKFSIRIALLIIVVSCDSDKSHYNPWEIFGLSKQRAQRFCAAKVESSSTSSQKANRWNVSYAATSAGEMNPNERRSEQAEKPIESFDEWTKKRRDAVTLQASTSPGSTTNVNGDVRTARADTPTRNFASRECGAKVIASNSEAENAKAVVNDKDVDDYLRNPCEKAKEKFIVIELCELIQISQFSIGNFELFSSRPQEIGLYISERFPPAEWISIGNFQLQDSRKLQTLVLPDVHSYAKFVKIMLNKHYGSEHYCIVSVVNVMGTTLVDEYEKEEAAVQLLNSHDAISSRNSESDPVEGTTTSALLNNDLPTQLPRPPRAGNRSLPTIDKWWEICRQCPVQSSELAVKSYDICRLFNAHRKINFTNPKKTSVKRNYFSEDRRRTYYRRRILAEIQRTNLSLRILDDSTFKKKLTDFEHDQQNISSNGTITANIEENDFYGPYSANVDEKEIMNSNILSVSNSKNSSPGSDSSILPGATSSNRETILMKLTKRIAAVELNLTLSTEYLRELSKQYVGQMNGYKTELDESQRVAQETTKNLDAYMRSKMNRLRREVQAMRRAMTRFQRERVVSPRFDLSNIELSKHTGETSEAVTELRQISHKTDEIADVCDEESYFNQFPKLDTFLWLLTATNVVVMVIMRKMHLDDMQRFEEQLNLQKNRLREEMKENISTNSDFQSKAFRKNLRRVESSVAFVFAANRNYKTHSVAQWSKGLRRQLNEHTKKVKKLFTEQEENFRVRFSENELLLHNLLRNDHKELVKKNDYEDTGTTFVTSSESTTNERKCQHFELEPS